MSTTDIKGVSDVEEEISECTSGEHSTSSDASFIV